MTLQCGSRRDLLLVFLRTRLSSQKINSLCALLYIQINIFVIFRHGKAYESLECLKELKQLAEENNLLFYLAQAYRYMGEYYLNQNQAYEATPLLMLAFYIFNDIHDLARREKVRTWAAISAGDFH